MYKRGENNGAERCTKGVSKWLERIGFILTQIIVERFITYEINSGYLMRLYRHFGL